MPTDKNEYTKNEDRCLWELHEVRRAYAVSHKTVQKINSEARKYIKKSGAKLKFVQLEQKKSGHHLPISQTERKKGNAR